MKVWYLKHPTSKYYDVDVKKEARIAGAKIIDAKFIGDNKNPSDCPKEKSTKKKDDK